MNQTETSMGDDLTSCQEFKKLDDLENFLCKKIDERPTFTNEEKGILKAKILVKSAGEKLRHSATCVECLGAAI